MLVKGDDSTLVKGDEAIINAQNKSVTFLLWRLPEDFITTEWKLFLSLLHFLHPLQAYCIHLLPMSFLHLYKHTHFIMQCCKLY